MSNIDSTLLRQLLKYDPESGVFTWLNNMGRRVKAGQEAGCLHHKGYVQIRIYGKNYLAHRLAWLYVHGEWPEHGIDHINGFKTENHISNLRQANQSQNSQNLKKSRGSSGFLGVSIDTERRNRWKASIKLEGKTTHLGWFKSPELAHEAYVAAKRSIHPFGTL